VWKGVICRMIDLEQSPRLRVRCDQDCITSTYGHSQLKTGHPVRSAIHKQLNGRLVLRWVTTWESLLLYVLHFFCSTEEGFKCPVRLSATRNGREELIWLTLLT
jgi:hypothetical protein